jgi:hypothetical protein
VSSEPPRDLADARVEQLTEVGLLTEREAQAYVLRDVYSMCREYTADRLGVSTSRVDNALRSARQRLQNARETVALTKDWATNQEYPRQLDRIDNEHVDGFDPVNIETIIEAVTRTVDPDVMVDAPDPVNYDSDEEFHAAEAKHLAAIDAAVWRAIEDKSQRELYTAVHQSGEKNTEEAAELLAPRWLPMSEKAFAATRDYFSTFADPKAHFDHSGQPQMSD